MKKILILGLMGFMGLMGNIAQAQFGDYGVKVGFGTATIDDDLSTKSPVLGVNLGGYINYTFAQSESILAEIFYLQSGLNIIHRGSNFEEIHEHANDLMERRGYYHAWYAQLPLLAGVHMELPIRQAGHVVGLYLGPALNVGLFGRYYDRKATPFNPSYTANYDTDVHGTASDRAVFNHISRLDVSAIVGFSYEYGNLTVSLFIENGFIATSEGEDVLSIITNGTGSGSTGTGTATPPAEISNHWPQLVSGNPYNTSDVSVKIPNGNNFAVMLSVAYRLGSFQK